MLCVVSRIVSGVLPDRIAPSSVFSRTYSRMYSLTKKRLCGDAFGFYDLYKECRGKHPGGAAAPPALLASIKQRKSNIINALLYFKYPDKCCYTVLRRGYSPTCVYDPDIKSCFYYLPPFLLHNFSITSRNFSLLNGVAFFAPPDYPGVFFIQKNSRRKNGGKYVSFVCFCIYIRAPYGAGLAAYSSDL